MSVVLIGSNLLTDGPGSSDPGSSADQPGSVSTAAQLPDSAGFVSAAVRFVSVWNRVPPGSSQTQWQEALAPLTTGELAQALASTDPADLPGSMPKGEPVVRYLAQSSALIAVPLANGSSVLVTVVSEGAGPKVSDVQPYAGDN
jgi:hypothetical protein